MGYNWQYIFPRVGDWVKVNPDNMGVVSALDHHVLVEVDDSEQPSQHLRYLSEDFDISARFIPYQGKRCWDISHLKQLGEKVL